MRRRRNAATFIELLVVIAIIVLLVSVLTPMLSNVTELAEQLICESRLEQIGVAYKLYLTIHNGFSDNAPYHSGGCGFWEMPRGTPIARNSPYWTYAFWGVSYCKYAEGVREIWRCPTAKGTDCDNFPATGFFPPGPTDWPAQPWVSYGLNNWIDNRSMYTISKPSTTIICHDAYEHILEGIQGGSVTDGLSAWGTWSNVSQWRNCYRNPCRNAAQYGRNHEVEYFRHVYGCGVLWYDNHITFIPETNGKEIPIEYYTGS